MSTAKSSNAAEVLADKQLQYAKLNAQLLAEQQYWMKSEAHKKSVRWHWLIIALGFYIVSKVIMLKAEFKQVFQIFNKNDANFGCLLSNDATAWNLVLSVAYPNLLKLMNTFAMISQPLSQDQGQFLWDSIRNNWIPTQDWIDNSCPASCVGLNLTPLSYICDNILSAWKQKSGKSEPDLISQIKSDPASTPWASILFPDSKLLDGSPNSDAGLGVLITKGFWGISKWKGTQGSEESMYSYIFNKQPEKSGCNNVTAFAGVATNAATFSMAGTAFGPEGTAVGATVGAIFGAGIGLFTPSAGCDKSPFQQIFGWL